MGLVKSIGAIVVKNGPTIATIAGTLGLIVAGGTACKATIKAEGVRVETVAKIEAIKESGYTSKKKYDADIRKEYIEAGKQMAKIYGPSILLAAVSVGAIFGGHKVLCGRNFMLTGAYKALTTDFDKYRARVADRFGPENERAVKYNSQMIEVEDPKTGEKKTVEYFPEDMVNLPTDRSRFFDESSIYWKEDPEENMRFLMKVLEEAQEKFKKEGYLLLSWVYEQLDVPVTYASTVCGWIKGLGDDYIDFGIWNVYSAASRRFVNGLEPVVLLTFNDDGYIADKI